MAISQAYCAASAARRGIELALEHDHRQQKKQRKRPPPAPARRRGNSRGRGGGSVLRQAASATAARQRRCAPAAPRAVLRWRATRAPHRARRRRARKGGAGRRGARRFSPRRAPGARRHLNSRPSVAASRYAQSKAGGQQERQTKRSGSRGCAAQSVRGGGHVVARVARGWQLAVHSELSQRSSRVCVFSQRSSTSARCPRSTLDLLRRKNGLRAYPLRAPSPPSTPRTTVAPVDPRVFVVVRRPPSSTSCRVYFLRRRLRRPTSSCSRCIRGRSASPRRLVGQRHKDSHGIHQKLALGPRAAAAVGAADGRSEQLLHYRWAMAYRRPAAPPPCTRSRRSCRSSQPKPGPTELTIYSCFTLQLMRARYQCRHPHSSWPRPASTIATTPSAHVSKYENARVKRPQK